MNAYLEKQKAIQQELFETGIRLGNQQILDYLAIALNDADTMGKALGEEKIRRVLARIAELYEFFHPAFESTTNSEADYYQELLDRRLELLCKKQPLIPFSERYDELKQIRYGGKHKGGRP